MFNTYNNKKIFITGHTGFAGSWLSLWFGFLMTIIDEKYNRNDFAKYLEMKGIQTRNLFAGNILKHPCFDSLKKDIDYRVIGDLYNTNKIMNDSLWVGVYSGLSDSNIDYMIKTIKEFLNE